MSSQERGSFQRRSAAGRTSNYSTNLHIPSADGTARKGLPWSGQSIGLKRGGMLLRPWFRMTLSRWHVLSDDISHLPAKDLESEVIRLWTSNGKFFGYRLDNSLFTPDGREAGQFSEGDEIYDRYGTYRGEIRKGNRLVTNLSKRDWTRNAFAPQSGLRFRPSNDLASIQIMAGFEDFPAAGQLP